MSLPPAEKHEKDEKKPTGRHSPDGNRPNMSDLRIVLLGKSLSENIRVRNFILRTDVMETEDLQDHSVKISGMVENRNISFINCSHLLQLNFSQLEITERVRDCVNVSDPGPHVFILILQHHNFSKKDKRRVKIVLKEFSDQAMKRTIVLTTDEDIDRSIHSSVRNNKFINQLINECGGGHLQFNEGHRGWRSEMIRSVDEILKKEPEEYLKCNIYEETQISSVDPNPELPKHEDSVKSAKDKSYHKDDGKPKESHEKNKDGGGSFSSVTGKSNLNVVLCGSDAGLKVNFSRFLRGYKTSHQTEFSSVCVKKEEKIHGHQISVVELPSLTQLSEDEAMHQSLHCLSLCDPGVHVFLIIIPVGPLTDKNKAEVEKIQKMFYSSKNFMVIFTTDVTIDRNLTDSLESYSECKSLISDFGGRYKVLELKQHEKSKQIPELLDYIKDMKTEPYTLQMYVRAQEMRVRDEYEEKLNELQLKINSYGIEEEEEDLKHLRIVLIGRTGSGKSATGNTILGRYQLESSFSQDSVTQVCEKGVCEVDGRSVAVVDTPGLFHTTLSNEEIQEEIMKCVSLSSPGPHAFIIVLSVGRFIQEELDSVDLIKKMFGPKVTQFSIILFTGGDYLQDQSIEDHVKRNSAELQKLMRDCGDRCLAFNNNETQDRTQVNKLIKMIEEMKTTNHDQYFTNSMFEEAEMSIQKRMEEILKEKEREIQAEKEEIKAKYEIEIKNMMKRLEEEKRKADEERVQMENKFKEQEETLKKEFEERRQRECEKMIDDMKREKEEEIRRWASEELNEFRERKEQHIKQLKEMLEERQKEHELLKKLDQCFKQQKEQEILEILNQHFKEPIGEETEELEKETERLKNKSDCVIL